MSVSAFDKRRRRRDEVRLVKNGRVVGGHALVWMERASSVTEPSRGEWTVRQGQRMANVCTLGLAWLARRLRR